jgi:hypothetical protein
MSRAAPPSLKSRRRPAAERATLFLRWRLADAGSDGPASLELRLAATGATTIRARLRSGRAGRDIPVRGRARWLSADGLRHLDLPGVLSISLRAESLRVLYARTDLVATLGLPGGRYEFDGAELTPG